MKFSSTYQEYMQGYRNELPGLGFKKLKKILKTCRTEIESQNTSHDIDSAAGALTVAHSGCPHECPVCDGTFFPSLLKEMSNIVCCFNDRAQKLLDLHLATGFKKYYLWCSSKTRKDHNSLIQEGQDLVTYAMINAIAVRKILKKYDKIHQSKQGQAFKSQAQKMHIEILQSPWLCELMAFHINLKDKEDKNKKVAALFEGCAFTFTDEKPALTCDLFDSIKLNIDLTCSICLDTVFDPVALTCGHIFCYICACTSASVTIVDGLSEASPKEKCPLCREDGVFQGAVHLEELNILLGRRCRDYWEERLQSERTERLMQAKKHWESQCRAFMGV